MNQPNQPGYPPQQPAYWPPEQQWPGHGQQQQQPQAQPMANPQVVMPGGQQFPAPQQQQQMPQAQPAGGPPAAPPPYEVDDAAIQAACQQAQEKSSGGGDGTPWFKFPPPQGFQDWRSAPANTQSVVNVWVCQPWPGGNRIDHSYSKHFFKYPEGGRMKGSSIDHVDGCGFCQSAEMARMNPQLAQSVENWGKKPRDRALLNVLMLDAPQLHMQPDGSMTPMVLDAGPQLYAAILSLVSPEGLGMTANLVDPYNGRPIRLIRKKTGTSDMDVDYDANYWPNASPLPQQFWPALHNIRDLTQLRKVPTLEDYQQAVMKLGWPVPGGAQVQVPQQAPVAGAYNPGPMPPQPNPYAQQQQPAAMPMAQPPQQPAAMPPLPPPMTPSQVSPGPPPPMSPPPVTASGAQPAPYQPQPGGPPPPANSAPEGQGSNGGEPPVPFDQGSAAIAQPTIPAGTPALQLDPHTRKLAPGIQLEGGRERCFGKHAPEDMMCKGCPETIKSQCVPQSPQVITPEVDAQLQALQAQLEGASG